MTFQELAIGAEFVIGDTRYRKASATKAHNLTLARDGAGPVRIAADAQTAPAPDLQAEAQKAKAEAAKHEQDKADAKKKPKPETHPA